MKDNKIIKQKNTPETVKGGRGIYPNKSICEKAQGNPNFTQLPQVIKVLMWIYCQTLKKSNASSFGSFNHNQDTAFRTHISILGKKGILINRKWAKNPKTKKRYKEYWLSNNSIELTEKILKPYIKKL
jgi:hypothetical protein